MQYGYGTLPCATDSPRLEAYPRVAGANNTRPDPICCYLPREAMCTENANVKKGTTQGACLPLMISGAALNFKASAIRKEFHLSLKCSPHIKKTKVIVFSHKSIELSQPLSLRLTQSSQRSHSWRHGPCLTPLSYIKRIGALIGVLV